MTSPRPMASIALTTSLEPAAIPALTSILASMTTRGFDVRSDDTLSDDVCLTNDSSRPQSTGVNQETEARACLH